MKSDATKLKEAEKKQMRKQKRRKEAIVVIKKQMRKQKRREEAIVVIKKTKGGKQTIIKDTNRMPWD
jgi:hypothetical protein